MEKESWEGMLEYQEDQKGLRRANLRRERLEHKILWRGPKNLSNNINFSHRINYYNSVDIINKSQLLSIIVLVKCIYLQLLAD